YEYATAGAYTYGGQDHPLPDRTTLLVDPADGERQRFVRDVRDTAGNGPSIETVLLFRPDGIYLESITVRTLYQGFEDVQALRSDPPALYVPVSATVGDRFTYELAAPATTATVDAVITREETIDVGGTAVRTFVVETTTRFEGTINGTLAATGWLSPERALIVREVVDSSMRFALIETRGRYESTMTSATP
ncbi:MAG: hypothetical protein H0W25_04910, partial [Acidimicrobiia bacterium]|nr:hypothetical protein [Acidimicrobiia bacterium]